MPRPSSLLAFLGTITSTIACVIPSGPLSSNITERFQIVVQNPAYPFLHNKILNFRPNGFDMHLVLRPAGQPTYDTIWLENGILRQEDRHAVIDLEHNENDNTTKMFMTNRQYATALFKPVYGCDPDTDELQIRIVLVSRLADPGEGQAQEDGGQIGIQEAGFSGVYEFRYSPANNNLLTNTWFSVNMVLFRDGITPPTTTTTSPSTPTSTASVADYDYVSCWAEPDDGSRTLTTVYSSTGMTNELCAIDCGGSEYFGTQYSVECWCGSSLAAGSRAAPSTDCSAACSGNSTQFCGGGRRLSLYKRKAPNSSGTTTISTASSSSSTTSSLHSSTSSSIAPTSTSSSSIAPSTTSSSSSSIPPSTSSSIPPTTSSSSTTSTTPSSSSTSTRSTTASTASATSTGLPSVGAYNFVSCWAEPPGGRALSAAFTSSDALTLEKCAASCSTFAYFGTEWNRECWCGNTLAAGSAAAPLSDCNYPCTGDATEMCGGSQRLSLYHNPGWTAPTAPTSIGSYEFYGCVTDSPSRTLRGSSLSSSSMTLERCATFCSGYTYFGAEWSVECWCGNEFTAGSAVVATSDCSMTCGGNTAQLCGNGDRLSVYKRVGA